MYKELFYLLFSFFKRLEFARTPALSSYLFICVLIGMNLTTIFIVIFHFLNISLANQNIDSTFFGVLFGSIIMLFNFFTLYLKRKTIFEDYRLRTKNSKIKGAIFGAIYIILSYVVIYVVAKAFLPWA